MARQFVACDAGSEFTVNEIVLANFFRGKLSAAELSGDLAGSEEIVDGEHRKVLVHDMDEPFAVTRAMAVELCESVLRQELEPDALRLIGFTLITSDRFAWDEDDDLLGEILWDWSCPEVNFALSLENVRRFKSWLEGVLPYPEKTIPSKQMAGRVIGETKRCRI
jgi:hypothetical protein